MKRAIVYAMKQQRTFFIIGFTLLGNETTLCGPFSYQHCPLVKPTKNEIGLGNEREEKA